MHHQNTQCYDFIRLFLLSRLFSLSFVLLSFSLISFIFAIISISELGLFSLSLVDNNYADKADKTLVYKVVSYTENCSLALTEYT